jgi:uncharacterized protein YbjT (DUF2867 family)
MKIVVIGGTGLIGKKVVTNLRQRGHEVVAASPSSGVNTVTGEGLAQALTDAQVVVDVANAPSWEDNAVLAFFDTSGRNLLAAEAVAGVGHHVALSVVGTDRLLASGYFRAKMAQEKLIKASPIPYTIVRATQFFEFVGGIAQAASEGQTVRLPPALMQPIAADDVAAVVADVALAKPLNGTFEVAGPEPIRQDDLVRQFLNATGDARTVITDPKALYYGITVNDQSLTPGDNPRIGPTSFEEWLTRSIPHSTQISFARDIRPLFRLVDISHMKSHGIKLDDYTFMSDPDNADKVLGTLSPHDGHPPSMPPGGPYWTADELALFAQWQEGGYQP